MNIALESQAELETQLEVVVRLGYATVRNISALTEDSSRVGRMLHGLQRKLEVARTRHMAILAVLVGILVALSIPGRTKHRSERRAPDGEDAGRASLRAPDREAESRVIAAAR